MIYLKAGGQKILKIVHLICSCLWIGSGFSMASLLLLGSFRESGEVYMYFYTLKIIDDFILIPGAVGCLITGLIYSAFTKWGFFKHKWLRVKWIMTVAQITFGTVALGPWINGSVKIARELGQAALTDPVLLHNLSMSKFWGSLQVLLLLPYIIISVQKPWKNKRLEEN